MSQLTFASLTPKKKNIRVEKFLDEMNQVVPWKQMASIIEPYYHKNKLGRKPMKLMLMLKIHCLQQWFNLSDPAAEEAIYDRISFQRFLQVDLMADYVPDETTILNFRHLLEKHDLAEQIFTQVNQHLQSKGLMLKEGTIVDASIIASPSSTKNKDKKRDPEMGSTKKGNNFHFGMKVHTGVDSSSGLVHSVEATSASVADKTMMFELLHGKEKAVFGDKGYISQEDKHLARDAGIFWGILDKRAPKKQLSSKQKKKNKKLSKIRSKVEHPYRIVKTLWGHNKTRYRGLEKNGSQFKILFALSNLYMKRKVLLGI